MKRNLLLLLLLGSALFSFAQASKSTLKRIDSYSAKALDDWNVPGMAVVIVKNDEVIYEKGFGTTRIDDGTEVNEHTLFAIASNSKNVTVSALATLVDQGKIGWDDKVREYLPWFELYDPYVSEEFTIRDLLCHRSGLATFSGDLLWYGSKYSRREVVEKAKYLKPVHGFRTKFGYQNIMYLAAGLVIEEVTGESWDDYVSSQFFEPLGMDRTITSTTLLKRMDNAAWPHNENGGRQNSISWLNWDNIGPAGSIITSVHDWSKWMQLCLGEGSFGDKEYWSSGNTEQMWTLHTSDFVSKQKTEMYPGTFFSGYGLGWQLQNFHGRKMVSHGGGYDGFISRTVLIPEEGIGVAVFTNTNSSLSYALTYYITEQILGVTDSKDWSETFLEYTSKKDDENPNVQNGVTRVSNTEPSCELLSYAGTYRDEMYGDLEVRLVGDELMFRFEPTELFRGTLRHWHYDTFQLNWGTEMMLPSGLARFELDFHGMPKVLHVDVQNPDFDFTELVFRKLD